MRRSVRIAGAPGSALLLTGLAALLGVAAAQELQPYEETIPGTLVKFQMVPVPGGTFEYCDPAKAGEATAREMRPFWIGKHEVTWDEFDVYAFRLDEPDRGGSEAQGGRGRVKLPPGTILHPTKPYGAPDEGFGHSGYPAIHVSYWAAREYCRWLSRKTGKRYRLPTEWEWEWACRAGSLASGSLDPAALDQCAWHWDNSDCKTHPVGSRGANAWGVCDMLGNAAEWVMGSGGAWHVVRGGSYFDPDEACQPAARLQQVPEWNARDPQEPKSIWWLSDAPFAGFRVVCQP